MQLFSTFGSHIYVEMAIAKLEAEGIKKENIFAVSLEKRKEIYQLADRLYSADSTSLIDIGMALAVAFSVIGTSIGFNLAWGPIIWGLIAAFAGFLTGFVIRLFTEFFLHRRERIFLRKEGAGIILIVDCADNHAALVEHILWEHLANGVAKVE